LRVYKLVGTEWTVFSTPPFLAASTSLSVVILESAYYAIEFVMPVFPGASLFSVYYEIAGTSEVWRISPLPDFDTEYTSIRGVRLNAASMLLTPDCTKADRAGRVSAAQLVPGASWLNYLSSDVGDLPTSTTLSFEKGAFGYIKPSSPGSYALRDVVHFGPGGVVSIQESLFEGADTIVFKVSVPSVSSLSLTFAAALIHVTVVNGVEFVSTSVWDYATPPDLDVPNFDRSLAIIRELPQFFENETHGEQILRFLKAGMDGVAKYGPAIMEIAAIIARIVAL